jgi:hypothetical protein
MSTLGMVAAHAGSARCEILHACTHRNPTHAAGVAAGCAAGVDFSSLLAWVAEVQLRYSTNEVAQVSWLEHVRPMQHQAQWRANTRVLVQWPSEASEAAHRFLCAWFHAATALP